MSERAGDDAHREAILALPWYVNDTLEPGERALVEAELARSAAFRAELARERRLAAAIATCEVDDFSLDQAFAELEGRLHRRPPWWARLKRSVSSILSPAVAMPLAAACIALVVVLGAQQHSDNQTFETMSNAAASSPQLKVLLAPGYDRAFVRALAKAHGLSDVAGPSATGVFTIGVAHGAVVDVLASRFAAHPAVDFVDVSR